MQLQPGLELPSSITPSVHINEIEKVALGAESCRDPAVVASWLRCINDYKLDPTRAQEAFIVPNHQLKEHREQAAEIIRIGKFGIENLFRHVASQNYVLLLSDAKGVAVEFLGDPTFNNHLKKAGLFLGSEWSESRAGTCAVGSCIVSREPVVIHQDDHFDTSHIGLTCTAAPIFDTLGDITAVVDLSQLRSPTFKTSQNLALHLVTTTARRIEFANFLDRTKNDWILRLSRTPEFVDVEPDAAIAIDARGRISGLTHGGISALLQSMHIRGFSTPRLIGQPISSFLELDFSDLLHFMRDKPARQKYVRLQNGALIFASASAPASNFRNPGSAVGNVEISKALQQFSYGDPAMQTLQLKAARLAKRDIPVLIQGETGSGKEFLARAIHESSCSQGQFVAVNCAAIPEQLIESELFGYAPGAFTGALAKGKIGLIETANGGTLFLDEIGDMPLLLQSRLLRVLSEQEVLPIGAQKPKPVSFRLLSASHRKLDVLVAERQFREDLYYRLNASTLHIPALRERTDIDLLTNAILIRLSGEDDAPSRLSALSRALIKTYKWPGNIRELTNALRLALVMSEGKDIDPECFPDNIQSNMQPPLDIAANNAIFSPVPPGTGLPKNDLLSALHDCEGNITELARRLGVNRSTIHRRLQRFGYPFGRRFP